MSLSAWLIHGVTALQGGRMNKLPLLVSVPHAGKAIPAEVAPICILSREDMLNDGDGEAEQIYAIEGHVAGFHTTDIARAIVDLNRAPDDFRPDGVIKTHTCWNVPIYKTFPSQGLITALLDNYYMPYHKKLSVDSKKNVVAGLDCHTMAEFGPPTGPWPERERPFICLSNAGKTCPAEWLMNFAQCLQKEFPGEKILLNEPFKGGHIIKNHAAEIPWLQIEFSRTSRFSVTSKKNGLLKALSKWHNQTWR